MKSQRKKFSTSEIAILQENKYTSAVTESHIHYTDDFKDAVWEILKTGRTPRMAFVELGYDPDILGTKRMECFAHRLRKAYGVKATSSPNGNIKDYSELSPEKAMAAMQHELKYLRQENAFLKKLSALENKQGR